MANFQTTTVQDQQRTLNARQMLNQPRGGIGQGYWLHATWTVPTTTVNNADTVELIRIPSSARVLLGQVKNESLGSTFTGQIGLAAITKKGDGTEVFTVAAAAAFQNSLALATARTDWTLVFPVASSQFTAANVGKQAWELTNTVTYSADPMIEFSIYITCTTVTSQTNGAVMALQLLVA